MSRVITYKGQSVFDIAVQEYGNVCGVFEILAANPGLQFDSELESGTILNLQGDIINKTIYDYYAKNNIKPSTSIEGLTTYTKEQYDMITKTYNYDLAGGDKTFEGIRLYNLNKDMTVQINYTDIIALNVKVYLESSLDGVNYSPIPGADYTLIYYDTSHTFYIYDLITNYLRLRVEAGSATVGIINEMLIKL